MIAVIERLYDTNSRTTNTIGNSIEVWLGVIDSMYAIGLKAENNVGGLGSLLPIAGNDVTASNPTERTMIANHVLQALGSLEPSAKSSIVRALKRYRLIRHRLQWLRMR